MKLQTRKIFVRSAVALIGLVTILALHSQLEAQSSYGSIVGTVTDNSGAVVAGATVTITDIGTNFKRTIQTGAAGEYRFAELAPTNYKVEVEAKSFKRFVQASATVEVDNTVRVDAVLQVGSATETVEVTTQPPLLQTDSGTLGSMVEGKQVTEMPLNGRNVMNLVGLVAGVVPQGATSGSTTLNANLGTRSSNFWANYQIGGGGAGQSAEYIDGTPINGYGLNNPAIVPTQDAIQEFKIATNVPSAEFGRFSGGVVEMATKSGGNPFHASLYEYLRNNKFNANSFFSKISGAKRPRWNQNQYGVEASGPIKRDKIFFMGSWEQLNDRLTNPLSGSVPSYNMEQGIFKNKTVKDPTGNCTTIAYFNASGGATNAAGTSNGAVAESVVPQSCFDPNGVALEGLFPVPSSSTPDATSYFINEGVGGNQYQYNGRGDYKISDKQMLFARYSYWNLADLSPREFPTSVINTGKAYNTNVTHNAVVGDTYTFNATTILDVRVSYLRENYKNKPPTWQTNATAALGPGWAALTAQDSDNGIPRMAWTGSDNLLLSGTSPLSNDFWDQYTLAASLLKIVHNHTIKFGGEIRELQRNGFNGLSLTNLPGNFAFNSATTGDEFAGQLMGVYQNAQITVVKGVGNRNIPQGYYVTDTWQVNRNLTANLGVRWELPGPITEKHNQNTVFLPNSIDPVTGLTGATVRVGSSLYPSTSALPVKKDLFAPRISLAYRLGSSMVLGTGYGITYLPNDMIAGALAYPSPVNSAQTSITTSQYHGLANPFGVLTGSKLAQPVYLTSSTTAQPFITQFKNQTISSNVPTNHFPYAQQWNLNLSRQMKGDWMVEAGYAGSKGTHLPPATSPSINELSSQYYPQLETMLASGSTSAQVTATGQALKPFSYFQNILNTSAYSYGTSYNSLQARTEKRFRNGGLIMAVYTWSKLMGNADNVGTPETNAGNASGGSGGVYQDYNNPRADRSVLSYDLPHRVVVNYVMPLPFGKGQKLGSSLSGPADKLVSGWALNGISTFQDGFPEGIFESSGSLLTTQFGANVLRPNVVPGCNKKAGVPSDPVKRYLAGVAGSTTAWFNAACFSTPGVSGAAAQFSFGNQPRNDDGLRYQGVDNFDFSVLKSTTFRERFDLQFRAEFFNLFNHTQFASPGLGIGGAVFNQVNTQTNQPRLGQMSLRLNF
jgi:hypothetical protein